MLHDTFCLFVLCSSLIALRCSDPHPILSLALFPFPPLPLITFHCVPRCRNKLIAADRVPPPDRSSFSSSASTRGSLSAFPGSSASDDANENTSFAVLMGIYPSAGKASLEARKAQLEDKVDDDGEADAPISSLSLTTSSLDSFLEVFEDDALCMSTCRQWALTLSQDIDLCTDARSVEAVSVRADGEVTLRAFLGFAQKRVAVGFHSLPKITSAGDAADTVRPQPKEDAPLEQLFFTCPRCGWELSVPPLDQTGVFKCSGGPCARLPDALLVQLPDGNIAPLSLQIDEHWIEYPVKSVVVVSRPWSTQEFRLLCDEYKTEGSVLSGLQSSSVVKEKLGGIQAMVSYEIIEELNEWFKDIDVKERGKLNRSAVRAYFQGGGGETGFYAGDTMFYYLDRNQDGWVSLGEFRYAILNIYKKDVKILRVEKIRSLRTKFNTLFDKYQDRLYEEKVRRQRKAEQKAKKEREKYLSEYESKFSEIMVKAAATGAFDDSDSDSDDDANARSKKQTGKQSTTTTSAAGKATSAAAQLPKGAMDSDSDSGSEAGDRPSDTDAAAAATAARASAQRRGSADYSDSSSASDSGSGSDTD